MKVSEVHLCNLIEYLKSRNVDTDSILSSCQIAKKDFSNPLETIESETYLSFLKHSIEVCGDDDFGLRFGSYLNLKSLGLILQISLNASKIETAISFLQEYLKATFPFVQIELKKGDSEVQLILSSSVAEDNVKTQLLDSVFCVIFKELKLMLPKAILPKLSIPHQRFDSYKTVLNESLISQTNSYSFVFPTSILSLEINEKRVKQIENILPFFMQELQAADTTFGDLSKRVRKLILNLSSPELPNIDQVIYHLPLSKRSFQRQLLKENTSFRKLVNGIKQKMAFYLEREGVFKTSDIAYILGYSEPSAFLHAKMKWGK